VSVDPKLIRDSFALVSAYGGDVVEYFYAHLFAQHPELRPMFPIGMAEQRDRLLKALALVVTNIDNFDELIPTLRQLGQDHRKFDVKPDHYDAVGASLLATLELFAGEAWTPRVAASWAAAYGLAAQTMVEAAEASSDGTPAWWEADVVSHERRSWDIAVFNVKPRRRYTFVPGQHVTIETMEWPKQWRRYSIANSPRPDGTLEFHVKQVDSGQVSWALVDAIRVGSVLRLGPPAGRLMLDEISPRAIVLIAGGTGLAPLKAILQHLIDRGETRAVHLFMGARTEAELYDLPAIQALAKQHWWLTVIPVVSREPSYQGYRGCVGDVAASYAPWLDRDIYICGPTPMVAAARQRLLRTGVQPVRIHHEIGLDLSSFELAATQRGGEPAEAVQPAQPQRGSADSGRLEPLRPAYGGTEPAWPAQEAAAPSTASAALVPVTPRPVVPPPLAPRPVAAQPVAPSPVPAAAGPDTDTAPAGYQVAAPTLDHWFAMQSPPTTASHVNGDADPHAAHRLQQLRAQIEYRRSLRRPFRR
jgi:NAD(P)H-flavin reductase/hemoglobin-like flavoprotein